VRVETRPVERKGVTIVTWSTRALEDTPARVGVYQASIRVAPYAHSGRPSPSQSERPHWGRNSDVQAPGWGCPPLLWTAPGIGLQDQEAPCVLLPTFEVPPLRPPSGVGTRGDPCRAGRKTRRSDGSWQHALPSALRADGRGPPQLSSRLFRMQNSAVARATLSRRRPRWSAMSDSFRACRHERAGRSAAPT